MSTIGELLINISANNSGLKRALSESQAAIGSFGNVMTGFAQGVGQEVYKQLSDVAKEIPRFIADSIDQADLLNKSVDKSTVVFEGSAGAIQAWANTTAESFGLGATAALDMADAVGNIASSAGIATPKAAILSKGIVQLASDLASFNNTTAEASLKALESGLEGSTKGLKSLGIVMTAQEVNQQATLDGAVKLNGAFTDAALVQARYEVILQKTSNAQGDFARNTGSLADAQARENAELQNAQAELGAHFLPVQIAVTNAQNDFFKGLGVVNKALGNFGNMLNDSYKSVDIFGADLPIATTAVDNLGTSLQTSADKTQAWAAGVARAFDLGVAATTSAATLMASRTSALAASQEAAATANGALYADRLQSEIAANDAMLAADDRAGAVALAQMKSAALAEAGVAAGLARAAATAANKNGVDQAIAYGAGLHAGADTISSALSLLKGDTKTEKSRPEQLHILRHELGSKEIQTGLHSSIPQLKTDAIAAVQAIMDQYTALGGKTSALAKPAAAALALAFKDAKSPTMVALEDLQNSVTSVLGASYYSVGVNAGSTYVQGIKAALGSIPAALGGPPPAQLGNPQHLPGPHAYALGGVVPGVGPQLAIVHGGELIVPKDQLRGAGGSSVGRAVGQEGPSGRPIIIEVHTHVDLDDHEIGQAVDRHLFDLAGASSSGFQSPGGVTAA